MTTRRLIISWSGLAALLIVSSCSTSTPARYYTLDPTATTGVSLTTPRSVAVGPVTIPASVDQPQLVTEAASNRVELDEFSRWASPLNENIARVVAEDLAVQLGSPDVTAAPLANFAPDFLVAIEVVRFESVRGQSALLEAVWTVHDSTSGLTRSGRTTASESVQDDSVAAIAAAHSRALSKLSSDIAAIIRSEAEANA